ncbi:MAG: SRPBCC family protein [Actinomycetota bacterium]
MDDYAVQMRYDVNADKEKVREALTTLEGIGSWWSSKVSGRPEASGGRFEVSFPDVPAPFEFTARPDGDTVAWEVGSNPEWWRGTTIRWSLEDNPEGPGTRIHFRHEGFEPEHPIIEVITPAWAHIIDRLKGYAETGERQPFFDF